MSHHIEHKPPVQPQSAPPEPKTTGEPIAVEPEHSIIANGNENGGVYFELSWGNDQAQNRRNQLLTNYAGSGASGQDGYDPSYNPECNPEDCSPPAGFHGNGYGGNGCTPQSGGYGDHGGYQYSSGNNQYDGNPNETVIYGYGGNQNGAPSYDCGGNSTLPGYCYIQSDGNDSLYSNESSTPLTWNDLTDLLNNQPGFHDYGNHSREFWRDVRQFSETPPFQDETVADNVSRYERLLNDFKSKEIPLDQFVKTLPPKEQELFGARYQIDQTFGEDIFEADGVTLNKDGQVRVREAAIDSGRFEDLPENVRSELRGKVVFVNERGEEFPTRRDAENAALFGENTPVNRTASEKLEAGELKLTDKSNQYAFGTNAATILTDNGATRAANHAANLDNSSSISAVARRGDGGTALGGALISGSFASVENFKNSENKGINHSGSVGNANAGGRNSFAAGATGAMMSAAIGSLVPGSDAVVSGVVGFVSGVVIGVEADQGLRWLSGDRPTTVAPSVGIKLPEENSFA